MGYGVRVVRSTAGYDWRGDAGRRELQVQVCLLCWVVYVAVLSCVVLCCRVALTSWSLNLRQSSRTMGKSCTLMAVKAFLSIISRFEDSSFSTYEWVAVVVVMVVMVVMVVVVAAVAAVVVVVVAAAATAAVAVVAVA